ncbi:AAA family ATPase [Corynebacterium aurimucosum]|uniref:KAP family P-loop NTPase fold protein n=1 Tax=Corynebacterium aurimucosum TaxID=169292 RepID=UPI0018799CDE|nr:P-loop NTPase fold protein [Corynebacterium aurimucosum]MBE7364196.1 AAA family ATPase [Corynebacterium aurimucosum]
MQSDFLRVGADDAVGEDILSREKLVYHACQTIRNVHSEEGSSVVSVVGAWGSGKTWVMERVAKELESSAEDPWKIARFTPWAVDSPEDLIGEFYQSLGEALELGGDERFQKMVARGVRFAGLFAGMVPVAGGTLAATSDVVADFLERPKSWNSLFNEVSKVVREKGHKVLVVADDIDRLQKTELYSLLKVIRLLGRFPGITFLLSMDVEAIGGSVGSDISSDPTGAGALGLQFVEKYIQYRISVPPLTDFQKTKLINLVLSECHAGTKFEFDLSSYEIHIFIQNWLRLPITIRTAQRFGNQLRATLLQLDPAEVDLIDVLNLQLLQTIYPYVFTRLPHYKKILTREESLSEEDRLYFEKQLIVGVPGIDRWIERRSIRNLQLSDRDSSFSEAEVVVNVLRELFPALNAVQSARRAKAERISDLSHFDRYFTLNIDGDDLSENEAKRVLMDAAKGKDSEFEALLDCRNTNLCFVIANRMKLSFKRMEPEFSPTECARVLMAVVRVLNTRDDLLEGSKSWLFWLIVDFMSTACQKLEKSSILSLLKYGDSHKNISPRIAWRVLENVNGSLPSAMHRAFIEYGRVLISSLIDDMAEGDRAPVKAYWRINSFIFLYKLCEYGENSNMEFAPRVEFHKAFGEQKFTAEDFSSRFVSVDPLAVSNSGCDEYRVEAFLLEYFRGFDDPFFHAPVQRDMHVRDDTWGERKKFVQGRCGGSE